MMSQMSEKRESIVINTGPVLALIAANGNLDLLSKLFKRVIVPYEVSCELLNGCNDFGKREFESAGFLERQPAAIEIGDYLNNSLDKGEAAVIQTALNLGIKTVCIDETVGRRIARLNGLRLTGSLGIIIVAKKKNLINDVVPAINNMRKSGIWISESLVQNVLELSRSKN